MAVKARCLKCKKRFDVVDWKDGEAPPCPVCGYPLTVSCRKHIKLVVLVVVLILLGLIVGEIILAKNRGDHVMGHIFISSEPDKKALLQMINRREWLPESLQENYLPSWVATRLVFESHSLYRNYRPPSLSTFSDLCEAEFEKPVPSEDGFPEWSRNDSVVVTQQVAQNPVYLTVTLRRAASKANKGDAGAMFLLGWVYERCWSAELQAYIWYKKAADKGNTDAMYYLGCIYRKGKEGTPQDYRQAESWYRKAADKGNVNAMYMLGAMCANGEGVQDDSEAVSWFHKAAENGNAEAMLILGAMYDVGIGVSQDYAEAYVWYSVATAFGNKNSEKARDIMASKLTPSAKPAAQSRAGELFKKIQKSMAE